MPIFHEQQAVFNRAPIDISVTFDGQQMTLKPGLGSIPKIAVPFGKNQNPVMGTQDPNNPHMSGAEYLIGVVGEDNCEPLTEDEWNTHLGKPCRINMDEAFEERYGGDKYAKMVLTGRGRKTTAKSKQEAGEGHRGLATFENR